MGKKDIFFSKWIIFCMAFFILVTLYNIYTINNFNKRMQVAIDKHENAVKNIEIKLKKQNNDLMTEFYKLRLDWANEKIDLEAKKGFLDNKVNTIYTIAAVIVTIMTILGEFVYGSIREYVEKAIKDKIEVEKDVIEDVIEDKDKERKVKYEKRIMMLAENTDKNIEVELFLTKMGFKHIYKDSDADNIDYNLIFINNQDNNIAKNTEELKAKMDNILNKYGEDKVYFYYNNTGVRFPNNGIKSNHANSKFTLYRQLVDTLIVSDKI